MWWKVHEIIVFINLRIKKKKLSYKIHKNQPNNGDFKLLRILSDFYFLIKPNVTIFTFLSIEVLKLHCWEDVWIRLGACLASWKKQSMFSKFFELILMSSTQQILFPSFCIILPTNKKGITSTKASINLLTKAVFYFFYFFYNLCMTQ